MYDAKIWTKAFQLYARNLDPSKVHNHAYYIVQLHNYDVSIIIYFSIEKDIS